MVINPQQNIRLVRRVVSLAQNRFQANNAIIMSIQASELILTEEGEIYHLRLTPQDIAHNIIFVGDPGRVDRVTAHFDSIRFQRQQREFYTVTGSYQGIPLTVISTGIGTDNIDIVMNELDALVNIDFETRMIKPELTQLRILRLGTSGSLQADVPVGTLVLSTYAVGGDGLLGYYIQKNHQSLQELLDVWHAKYARKLPRMVGALASKSFIAYAEQYLPEIQLGGTFTAAGFYGPQGRSLGRLKLAFTSLTRYIAEFVFEDRPVMNMEMETSGILALGNALGHQAGSLSVLLANRSTGEFSADPLGDEEKVIQTGLHMIHALATSK